MFSRRRSRAGRFQMDAAEKRSGGIAFQPIDVRLPRTDRQNFSGVLPHHFTGIAGEKFKFTAQREDQFKIVQTARSPHRKPDPLQRPVIDEMHPERISRRVPRRNISFCITIVHINDTFNYCIQLDFKV